MRSAIDSAGRVVIPKPLRLAEELPRLTDEVVRATIERTRR
jgi:bifunctional DNA-binding transcriptional regulator/antitoxin component of YhaV-PrlF toxin-antitoxin module